MPAEGDRSAVVAMGRVAGAFGVQGWVRIHPYSDEPGALAAHGEWLIGQGQSWQSIEVMECEVHGRMVVARLHGIQDRDAAALLRGQEIAVPRANLPPVAEGEFYWSDLVGLEVLNGVGEALGTVVEVFSNGAQEVLRVRQEAAERLIPFVPAYVQEVHLESRRITVDWQRDW